jgi:hypothetical protein
VANEFVTVVEPNGVGALQPSHPGYQICIWGLHHQVVMVAHQAVGVDLPSGLLTGFREGFEEIVLSLELKSKA